MGKGVVFAAAVSEDARSNQEVSVTGGQIGGRSTGAACSDLPQRPSINITLIEGDIPGQSQFQQVVTCPQGATDAGSAAIDSRFSRPSTCPPCRQCANGSWHAETGGDSVVDPYRNPWAPLGLGRQPPCCAPR